MARGPISSKLELVRIERRRQKAREARRRGKPIKDRGENKTLGEFI